MTSNRWIWADGLATVTDTGTTLDTFFPEIHEGRSPENHKNSLEDQGYSDDARGVVVMPVTIEIALDAAPHSTSDAYLRLHALSHRVVKPNELSLDGIFGFLPNVAWSTGGPLSPDYASANRTKLQRAGLHVHSLDKFPRLTDYVFPAGVRIADASRVRLGAYLSPGTTVMHEGFVNFNAGTLGASMVEGRISQGVVVGDGSDIGGGASIMGTLSGGGTHRISIGERTLLGANAGVGISIGADCIVEAGLYVTAGSKITLVDAPRNADGTNATVKGSELSGKDNLLFRRNSVTGAIEAVSRNGAGVTLNDALHA